MRLVGYLKIPGLESKENAFLFQNERFRALLYYNYDLVFKRAILL